MLILPLPVRLDWHRPPFATLLLICLCIVAFVLQSRDWNYEQDAARYYRDSSLASSELPAYVDDLQERDPDTAARLRPMLKGPSFSEVWRQMEGDQAFMTRLQNDQVITPKQRTYVRWHEDRRYYNNLRMRSITERFALKPQAPTAVTLFTHLFLHSGLLHLAGNLAVLLMIGIAVESVIGSVALLGLFTLGGIASTLPDLIAPPAEFTLSLGASGAIAAIMAAYLIHFGRKKIDFFYWAIAHFGHACWPAVVVVPLWLLNELLQCLTVDRNNGLNYLDHLVGFAFGALLIAIHRWQKVRREIQMDVRAANPKLHGKLLKRARDAVKNRQFAMATDAYRALSHAMPDDQQIALDFLKAARLANHNDIIRDAAAHLLTVGARNPGKILPSALAAALTDMHPHLPRFSAKSWRRVVSQLVNGREIEAAEKLVLQLLAQADQGQFGPELIHQLNQAIKHAEQPAHASRLMALLQPRTITG